MKLRKRELAKVGIYGSKDNPVIVTEKDLQEIAETFTDIGKSPVSLTGHWLDASQPRLGNVTSVEYDKTTQTLSGEIEEDDTLADAVDQGYYPDVSIGAKQRASDGKMYLHHLAYLGEEPPAIKDLKTEIKETLGFAASDKDNYKELPCTTSKRLSLSDIETFLNENKEVSGESSQKPSPSGLDSPLTQTPPQESLMEKEEIEALQAENARLKEANGQNEKLLSDQAATQKTADIEALKKATEGKLSEPETKKLLALCDSFDAGKTIELTDGNTKSTVNPIKVLADIFATIPLKVAPGTLNLSDGNAVPAQGRNLSQEMMKQI